MELGEGGEGQSLTRREAEEKHLTDESRDSNNQRREPDVDTGAWWFSQVQALQKELQRAREEIKEMEVLITQYQMFEHNQATPAAALQAQRHRSEFLQQEVYRLTNAYFELHRRSEAKLFYMDKWYQAQLGKCLNAITTARKENVEKKRVIKQETFEPNQETRDRSQEVKEARTLFCLKCHNYEAQLKDAKEDLQQQSQLTAVLQEELKKLQETRGSSQENVTAPLEAEREENKRLQEEVDVNLLNDDFQRDLQLLREEHETLQDSQLASNVPPQTEREDSDD